MSVQIERAPDSERPAPEITYRVSHLDGNETPPTPPAYTLIAPMFWGFLNLEDGRMDRAISEGNDRRRELKFQGDRLIGITFYDPGNGIDIDDLPLGEGQPTQEQLRSFFEEHDVFIGRKTPEQVKQEFDERAERWIADVNLRGEPDYDHPDYVNLVQLENRIVPWVLERWQRNPNEPWRWVMTMLAFNIASVEGIDEWDPFSEKRVLSEDKAREAWLGWGVKNGLIVNQTSIETT